MFRLFQFSLGNLVLKICVAEKLFLIFFIDKCVKKFLDNLFIKRKKVKDSSTKKEITVPLEFLGKISLQVKRQLIEIFRTVTKTLN